MGQMGSLQQSADGIPKSSNIWSGQRKMEIRAARYNATGSMGHVIPVQLLVGTHPMATCTRKGKLQKLEPVVKIITIW